MNSLNGNLCLKESTTYLGIWYKHFWAIFLAMKSIFLFRVGIWYKHFWAICLAMKSIFWKLIFRVGRRNPKGLASYPLKRLSGKGLIRTSQEYIRGGKFEMMRMITRREIISGLNFAMWIFGVITSVWLALVRFQAFSTSSWYRKPGHQTISCSPEKFVWNFTDSGFRHEKSGHSSHQNNHGQH